MKPKTRIGLFSNMLLVLVFPSLLTAGLLLSLVTCSDAPIGHPREQNERHSSALPTEPVAEELPQRLGVIPMPSGHGSTAEGIVHPNGNAYILNHSGSIAVVNGPHLLGLITWPEAPYGITINPVTEHIYVMDRADALYIISGTQVLTTAHNFGYQPLLITTHPTTGYTYVGYVPNPLRPKDIPWFSGVAVLTGTQIITSISIGRIPQALVVNPVDKLVYVGYNADEANPESLMVISNTTVVTRSVLGSVNASSIDRIAVNKQTGEMYMLQSPGRITYYNGQATKVLPVGKQGHHVNEIAIDARHNWVYATSWEVPTSQVLVIQEDKILATIPVGDDPRAVVVDETHDYVYVANRLSGTMSVIRGTAVITTLETMGWGPAYITLDETRGYIYVSNSDSASIAVFGFADAKH